MRHCCRGQVRTAWGKRPPLDDTREETAIIGDRMDTDIVAGVETDIETILVLSGVTRQEDLALAAYGPHHVLEGVFEIPD